MPDQTRDPRFIGTVYDVVRGLMGCVAWLLLVSGAVFMRRWMPAGARAATFQAFSATIREGVLSRHRVHIHWPWKLAVGDHRWIGKGAWIINLELVTIGEKVCISQGVLTGSHDRRFPTFEFDNIEDVGWVDARATVLRGVRIGPRATIGASALVMADVPEGPTIFNTGQDGR